MESLEINVIRLGIVAVILVFLTSTFYATGNYGRLLSKDESDSDEDLIPIVNFQNSPRKLLRNDFVGTYLNDDSSDNDADENGNNPDINVDTVNAKVSPIAPMIVRKSVLSSKALMSSSWPKGSTNNNNSGRTSYRGDLTGNLIWKYKVNSLSAAVITQFYASPVIDTDGNIIIGESLS